MQGSVKNTDCKLFSFLWSRFHL